MVIVRAPVRISFGGGGTDLAAYYAAHGGFVVSAAITRYCYVIAREPADGRIHISSADYRSSQIFRRGVLPPVEEPLTLPKAALEYFAGHGLRERGVDLFLSAEVPPSTGLGSSSAMAVGLMRALAAYTGVVLDRARAAELGCWLEIERLRMPIGKQDQYASAFGGLNTIEFSAEGVRVRPLGMSTNAAEALAERLLLFATGQTHNSAAILPQQRADSGSKALVIEALHRIKALAEEMRAALLAEDLDRFGRLLDRGWREKRRLSNKVSTPAIDGWYAAARAAGALGGKIAGAGGGGFLLLYCPPHRQAALRAKMANCGLQELPFSFDWTGAQVVAVEPEQRLLVHETQPLALELGR